MLQATRRAKSFGYGITIPADRNAKTRLIHKALALADKKNLATGRRALSLTTIRVLKEIVWQFHNAKTGKCFPSYEAIQAAAHCARSDVALAIKALETAGLLTWVNRIARVKRWIHCELLDKPVIKTFVVRTSNAYCLTIPPEEATPPKSDDRTGTTNQVSKIKKERPTSSCPNDLITSLSRYAEAFGRAQKPRPG